MSDLKNDSIVIKLLQGSDIIVLQKQPDSRVFVSTGDSIIISRGTFIMLLRYLVDTDIISPAVLQGILEERFTK